MFDKKKLENFVLHKTIILYYFTFKKKATHVSGSLLSFLFSEGIRIFDTSDGYKWSNGLQSIGYTLQFYCSF